MIEFEEDIERDAMLLSAALNGGLARVISVAIHWPEFAGGPDTVTAYSKWIAAPERKDYRKKVAAVLDNRG